MANELMVVSEMKAGTCFSSIPMDGTAEQKKLLYRATNKPDFKVGDCIGKTFMIKDVYIEIQNEIDDVTGEVMGTYPNMIFIDEEGKTIQTSSRGIFAALRKIFNIFGSPTWETPIAMTFTEEKSAKGNGRYHTIEIK